MTQKILFFVNWPSDTEAPSSTASSTCGSISSSTTDSYSSFDQMVEVTSLDKIEKDKKQNLLKWIRGNEKKKRKYRSRINTKYDFLYGNH